MRKAIISCVWLILWAMPLTVGIFGGSPFFVLIGIVWGLLVEAFTKNYAPSWILTAWEEIFPFDKDK